MSTDKRDELLSNMDRAVLSMPLDLAFSGDIAQFQYHERVQALIRRIDEQASRSPQPPGVKDSLTAQDADLAAFCSRYSSSVEALRAWIEGEKK